jgi:3D (Asp-Asp-Asp) domain-containing protein
MARALTFTDIGLRASAHVWRDLRPAFHRQLRTLLLLVAICIPMVAKSIHVQEDVTSLSEYLSKQSGDLRENAGTVRNPVRLRSKMITFCRLRSILADPNVSADFVSPLHSALVSENSAPADSRDRSALQPFDAIATPPFNLGNSYSDSLDYSFKSSTSSKGRKASKSRLARLTTYWPEEGDYYTKHGMSSTGVRLRDGHCAVDPRVIPYGSVVTVPGLGKFIAVDTGPAVVSRQAAQKFGQNSRERSALVVDIYCSTRSRANALEASSPKFAIITWSGLADQF